MRNIKTVLLGLSCLLAFASWSQAGPVILGGDDLDDHGSGDGTTNNLGWLYIEKAIDNLDTNVTRPGPFTVDVAALGSADNPACPPACSGGDSGDAIKSAAAAQGMTVQFFEGAAAITQFFTDLGTGAVNPKIIRIAGNGASNGTDSSEGAVYTANAAALDDFVTSGGGLMAHGSGPDIYGWLTVLLPGLLEVGGCNSSGATLTADGMAAFPALTNSDVDANAGPCHSHFEGDRGGLLDLVLDGTGVPYIIGGAKVTIASCESSCAKPEALHVDGANHLLVGTPDDDILCGDDRENSIRGQGGNDIICGFGGDDFLQGGNGEDEVYGGEGNDTLRGGKGNSKLFGEEGHDRLFTDSGDDLLDGGPGNDLLRDDKRGNDILLGGEGDDRLYAGKGDDELDGGPGNDRLYGGSGDDELDGGDDEDLANGGSGIDTCVNAEKTVKCP